MSKKDLVVIDISGGLVQGVGATKDIDIVIVDSDETDAINCMTTDGKNAWVEVSERPDDIIEDRDELMRAYRLNSFERLIDEV